MVSSSNSFTLQRISEGRTAKTEKKREKRGEFLALRPANVQCTEVLPPYLGRSPPMHNCKIELSLSSNFAQVFCLEVAVANGLPA